MATARGGLAAIESSADFESSLRYKALWAACRRSPLVNLAEIASREVYAACGLNAALWATGPGASVREAWRLALFGVLSPLGKKVERELQDKLDDEVTLSWQELRASDLSGRARSFQSMVNGGMDVQKAIAVAGLMTPD